MAEENKNRSENSAKIGNNRNASNCDSFMPAMGKSEVADCDNCFYMHKIDGEKVCGAPKKK